MTNSLEMTEKMQKVVDYINFCVVQNGYPPTVRDICKDCGISSTASVKYYLDKMEAMGVIRRAKQKSRAVELQMVKGVMHRDIVNIPLVGDIPAGTPQLALETYNDIIPFPNALFPASGNLFMLRVVGTSMIDVGIYSGDYVIVRSQQNCDNGQIAVVMWDDCATVKRFYRERGYVRLHPENQSMKDILTTNCHVLGVVVGLVRTKI